MPDFFKQKRSFLKKTWLLLFGCFVFFSQAQSYYSTDQKYLKSKQERNNSVVVVKPPEQSHKTIYEKLDKPIKDKINQLISCNSFESLLSFYNRTIVPF